MPTAYPDPYSGLSQGLLQGFQVGNQIRANRQAEVDRKQKEVAATKKTEFDQNLKVMDVSMKRLAMKGITNDLWLETFNTTFRPAWNKLSPGSQVPELTERPVEGAQFAKRILEVHNSDNPLAWKQKAVTGILLEAQAAGKDVDSPAVQQIFKTAKEAGGGLPYKIGKRETFTSKDGKKMEGTFQGSDPTTNEPIWSDVRAVKGKSVEERLSEWEAAFEKRFTRPPSKEELRAKMINDPYGTLEPIEEEGDKPLDRETAQKFLDDNNGNREKAEAAAKAEGYQF
jgi:hypothetical protein